MIANGKGEFIRVSPEKRRMQFGEWLNFSVLVHVSPEN